MLIEFRFKNYRSFRDEAVLSMEASGLGMYKNSLIKYNSKTSLLPGVAIYGKNGGGKSNVIRAFWLAVQFIKNAQRTQHADAPIPVHPFRLNDYSQNAPSAFEFIYTLEGIKYWYAFSADRERVYSESLYYAPKGQKALVFTREGQEFDFTEEKTKRKLIAKMVAPNQQFEMNSKEIQELEMPEDLPEGVRSALARFLQALSQTSDNADAKIAMNEVKAISMHQGKDQHGNGQLYPLDLSDESDGTRTLMSIAPAIESVLANGGVLLTDEIEKGLHPLLVDYIVAKFQSKETNPKGAQLIFTTHNTELLNMELLRKDQIYFADKNHEDGSSELYSISEFGTRTTENIRKGYLLGKYGAIPDLDIEEVK